MDFNWSRAKLYFFGTRKAMLAYDWRRLDVTIMADKTLQHIPTGNCIGFWAKVKNEFCVTVLENSFINGQPVAEFTSAAQVIDWLSARGNDAFMAFHKDFSKLNDTSDKALIKFANKYRKECE